MQEVKGRGGVAVDHCGRCGGTWYDAGEYQRIFHVLGPLQIQAEGEDPRRSVPCPTCDGRLIEVTWPAESRLRVDTCPVCRGLWLDAGEAVGLKEHLARIGRLEAVDFSHTRAAGEHIVVIPGLGEVYDATGLNWRWVLIGAVVLLVLQGVAVGFLQGVRLFDILRDARDVSSDARLAVTAQLLAMPLGGFLVGRSSPGYTLLEPALASVPAVIVFAALTPVRFSTPEVLAMMALGVLLTLGGAKAGEGLQRA